MNGGDASLERFSQDSVIDVGRAERGKSYCELGLISIVLVVDKPLGGYEQVTSLEGLSEELLGRVDEPDLERPIHDKQEL